MNAETGTERPDLEGLDAFEAFNRMHGGGRVVDPYPRLAELRRQGPVHKIAIRAAGVLPKSTDVEAVKLLPEIVTESPPSGLPFVGEMETMAGGLS